MVIGGYGLLAAYIGGLRLKLVGLVQRSAATTGAVSVFIA